MNIILDVGNVLVDYKPLEFLRGLFSDETVVMKMNETIFGSQEWLLMDQGKLALNEAIDIFHKREPEYISEIDHTIKNVNSMFTPITDTIKLLPKIKESGHGLYYLSNIQKDIRDHLVENHEYLKLFDGGVFSCDIRFIKPSPEMYRHLLEKYRLDPADCVFFDDMEVNVAAAEKEGIKSVLFTTAECVLDYL